MKAQINDATNTVVRQTVSNQIITADLNKLELATFTAKSNPRQRCRSTFPLLGTHGTKSSAAVYFELSPGDELGRHTDSAEEMLLILQGTVEATIGDQKATLKQGQIAVVPQMIPHNLENSGTETAKVLGFFGGANHIIATFDEIWLPLETNSVDTSKMG
jgi:quercetin dioxygenase-like cupin family protein